MANDGLPPSSFSDIPDVGTKPIYHERHMKIICIGAGASGLLFAYKLQRSFENFHLTLYEKNKDIGGTWYENKYPGCACDIPAHVYTWTFEPKTDWSAVYAGSDEIHRYFDAFSNKYDLRKYCKFTSEVTGAYWNELKGGWDVEVTDLNSGEVLKDYCDILINGSGVLNAWQWPAIPGLKDFKGKLLHTARWDRTVDLTGMHVGLIGNGSSAIQVLPAIHDTVKKILNFVRRPTWVSPPYGMEQHIYSEDEREEFQNNPTVHLLHRKEAERKISALFNMFIAQSDAQKTTYEAMVSAMKARLGNPALEEMLIPKWAVGCRRITPGPNYLETLSSEKVEIIYGDIERITEQGILSENGQEYAVDVLICATGFDTSFKPRFPLVGPNGTSLADDWAHEVKNYFGVAAPGFPNYFMFIGPNSPIGNGPVLCGVETQADYMLKFINRWQTENIHSFSPKVEAVDDFMAYKDQFMKSTVWEDECRSWYKSNSVSGKVTALWPGSTLHYLEALAEPRYDDWNIKYIGNRFSFLGNGFSQTESDPTADLAYYVRQHDDSPYLGRRKQTKVMSKSGTFNLQTSSESTRSGDA